MRRALSLVLALTEMLILSITLVPASTVGCSEIEQATKDLDVIPKLQRKDTRMLCLDGCYLTGPHAWDVEHEITGCEHDDWYCLRASIPMIASLYGGDLSQDRISYHYFQRAVHACMPPSPSNATARNDEPEIWVDSDSDGIVDFDETNRFFTDPYNNDTDSDDIDDKTEIRSYIFPGNGTFDSQDVLKPDVDEDGLRAELDFDSACMHNQLGRR